MHSSCVNLKQIGVVFVLLKIDLSELSHLGSSVITFVLQTQHRFFPKNPILEFSKRWCYAAPVQIWSKSMWFSWCYNLSNNVGWPYWKVCKIARSFSQWEYASRFGLATSLAIFAILHTFQYGHHIVGKFYGWKSTFRNFVIFTVITFALLTRHRFFAK